MSKITIDDDTCKGCALCVNACPKGIVRLNTERLNAKGFHPASVTDEALCISCAFCAVMCPDTAITVRKP